MGDFQFHPELFEVRNRALEMLSARGLEWLTDFSSVDILQDIYGLEVCGIPEEGTAETVLEALRQLMPSWRHSRLYLKDWGDRDLGWKVLISRDPENYQDDWQGAR